jgi:hypothetical protein
VLMTLYGLSINVSGLFASRFLPRVTRVWSGDSFGPSQRIPSIMKEFCCMRNDSCVPSGDGFSG